MKIIKQYILICLALITLTACPGSSNVEDVQEGQAYTQKTTMPSNASEQIVTLYQLNSPIKSITNPSSWLIVEQQTYSSGSPQIKLISTDNKEEGKRWIDIIITAASGETVVLTVTQEGKSENQGGNNGDSGGAGIDYTHDNVTDKAAYTIKRF